MKIRKFLIDAIVLPAVGIATVLLLWSILSNTLARELPSPLKTWEESKLYVLHPFTYRGELDQGIGLFTWLSLKMVMKGYFLALVVGTPLGFLLGSSQLFRKMFDPIFQILRPVSPLAWFPLGLMLFSSAGKMRGSRRLLAGPALHLCAL